MTHSPRSAIDDAIAPKIPLEEAGGVGAADVVEAVDMDFGRARLPPNRHADPKLASTMRAQCLEQRLYHRLLRYAA